MKKLGAEVATLTPDAHGWRIRLAAGTSQSVKTLEEAVAVIPLGQDIHLALPGNLVLLERLSLPAVDREEISGMVQLQLEKTLPYSVEEATSGFEIVSQVEDGSTVLSIAANVAQLDALCEPFRGRGRLPQKISLFAMHVASACPAQEVVLCIWPEDGQLEIAICERGKLGFAQNLSGNDLEMLRAELPHILLSAEMEGVSTDFSRVWIPMASEELCAPLSELLDKPVELVSFDFPAPDSITNLAPPSWQAEVRRLQKAGRLRHRVQVAAVLYLLAIAGAFLYLAWTKSRVQKLDHQLAQAQPEVDSVRSRQQRWEALAPALDPDRSTLEILFQVFCSLPAKEEGEIKITTFENKPSEFRLEGEAPSANLIIEFVDKLKKQDGLRVFQIESPPPRFLPNGNAQYSIIGKI